MHYRGLRKRKRDKGPEKIFEEIIAENVSNMGKETVTQVQEAQSSTQDKPKEKHAKTHINKKDKEKILKATRMKQQKTNKGIPIRFLAGFSA